MSIVAWVLIGASLGLLASKIMRTDAQEAVFLNVMVGMTGAIVGGFVWGWIALADTGVHNVGSWLTTLIGASVFLSVLGLPGHSNLDHSLRRGRGNRGS
jgi:uncharacterized membrane protein YeaQ/YmgE (transglycosylase-associated protein family)